MAGLYEVKITEQAIEHIQDISNYISYDLCAPDTAYNLINEVKKKIKSLCKNPKIMRLVDEEPWRSEGVRKTSIRHFLIYFWIDEENMTVWVIAVIYEKRDQIEQLKKLKQ